MKIAETKSRSSAKFSWAGGFKADVKIVKSVGVTATGDEQRRRDRRSPPSVVNGIVDAVFLASGETSCGYDALSLPPVRRIVSESGSRWDRDRRATSECFQRRLAHVPGKRRAPLPPVVTVPSAPSSSLNRRSTRKRRAPQPPIKIIENNKENLKTLEGKKFITQMNPHSNDKRQKIRNSDVTMDCKSEKYSTKEGQTKDTKHKPEKSFLKQIFDSKKRNSGVDISSVKLLPSISELDKQAAEIIESCKLNASEKSNNVKSEILDNIDGQSSGQFESWICVSCLRKYKISIVKCLYCLPNQEVNQSEQASDKSKALSSYTQTENNLSNSESAIKNTNEEKQKLKEMLKEMKDSLPKRPKHVNETLGVKTSLIPSTRENSPFLTETPTLRVGCTIEPSTSHNIIRSQLKEVTSGNRSSPVKPIQVKLDYKNDQNCENLKIKDIKKSNQNVKPVTHIEKMKVTKSALVTSIQQSSDQIKSKLDLHTPLRISSLLNPVYVSKNLVSNKPQDTPIQAAIQTEEQRILQVTFNKPSIISKHTNNPAMSIDALAGPSTSESQLPVTINKVENKYNKEEKRKDIEPHVLFQRGNIPAVTKKDTTADLNHNNKISNLLEMTSAKENNIIKKGINPDQHTRRRDLIHQLEQSIAKGDERAAAEAASKLAQLRLSCSVLSFSSQILSQPSTSKANTDFEGEKNQEMKRANKEPPKIVPNEKTRNDTKRSQNIAVNKIIPSSVSHQLNVPNISTVISSSSIKDTPKNKNSVIQKTIPEAKKTDATPNGTMTTIAVLVEDREATRGPVHLRINRQALMRDLRREAETSLGLPTNLQRWIVGRVLCVNDNIPISSLAGPDFSAPFYLCVVEADRQHESASGVNQKEKSNDELNKLQTKASDVYKELVQLEQQALVPNAENFECGVCMEEYTPGNGVVLRECVHIFCRNCLADVVRYCDEPDIPCPAMGCRGMLQEREIRALVTPQDYERWLARGLAAAESGTRNAFHCRTRDCKGWALCDPDVQKFPCPVCKHINCIPCQAIHDGLTCEQHRAKLKQGVAGKSGNANATDDSTRSLLNALIAKGEALQCPECSAIITKKWGCDWVKCSACKTEICWVTRGRRWGPGGKGDTSGGCRCGVDGKRCHPSCGYCH
ncbi:unnamed protein product [Arctia plantaginis]|uniref:RanBP-type and C3HC4-type zinc finger-containing protein 1 n=1 Tax=Arctia plantaginis TaxID=874455 RepID=A0A8S1AU21_ARCPL|nr:unnamed protein product [Arctia plantaginis]